MRDCRKIEFDEVLDVMTSVSQSPIECVESTAQIDDLTLLTSFLLFESFPREQQIAQKSRREKGHGQMKQRA